MLMKCPALFPVRSTCTDYPSPSAPPPYAQHGIIGTAPSPCRISPMISQLLELSLSAYRYKFDREIFSSCLLLLQLF